MLRALYRFSHLRFISRTAAAMPSGLTLAPSENNLFYDISVVSLKQTGFHKDRTILVRAAAEECDLLFLLKEVAIAAVLPENLQNDTCFLSCYFDRGLRVSRGGRPWIDLVQNVLSGSYGGSILLILFRVRTPSPRAPGIHLYRCESCGAAHPYHRQTSFL